MSGGHWDYVGARVRDGLESIGTDEHARAYWPYTSAMIAALAPVLYNTEREMDWALSGDTNPHDLPDLVMAAKILDAVLQAAPDAWFPRGKWATIQAVQSRAQAARVHASSCREDRS